MVLTPYFERLIPIRFPCCIAGGAAVDMRASDVDIFILNVSEHEAAEVQAEIAQYVNLGSRDIDLKFPENGGWRDGFSYPMEHAMLAEGTWYTTKVQIIGVPVSMPERLIERFDISTHMVAYTRDGTRHTCNATTSILETPVVCQFVNPNLTFKRLRKICKRYDLSPRSSDLLRLFQAEPGGDGDERSG